MRGLFVTGTGTGVGKTVLSAALLAAMAAAGERVRAHKPVVTGLDPAPRPASGTAEPQPPGRDAPASATPGYAPPASATPGYAPPASATPGYAASAPWPPDHELLARAAGMESEAVTPLRYGPAVSPHLAASLAGARIDPAGLLAAARGGAARPRDGEEIVIVEGVGGLLVPLAETYTVRDFAVELGLPLLIAARPGLGTINHTLLTLHAARAAGLDVRTVVLTPWPREPSVLERSNRETIARLGEVEVEGLPPVPAPERARLADAGAELPWRRWLTPEG